MASMSASSRLLLTFSHRLGFGFRDRTRSRIRCCSLSAHGYRLIFRQLTKANSCRFLSYGRNSVERLWSNFPAAHALLMYRRTRSRCSSSTGLFKLEPRQVCFSTFSLASTEYLPSFFLPVLLQQTNLMSSPLSNFCPPHAKRQNLNLLCGCRGEFEQLLNVMRHDRGKYRHRL